METPLVSICCITYNHVSYIRQCLDGFMMQKVNFPIEVLIHDDASTDGTADIIREYEAKYPSIIKPIYQQENQYSKGVIISLTYNYPRVKGKYVAMCEGDDYWTDPYKLQKQVDFLESHPDYSMCSHRFLEYDQTNSFMKKEIQPFQDKNIAVDYDLNSYIKCEWLTQTLSVLYRFSALDLNHLCKYNSAFDVIVYYQLLKSGKGCMLPDVMGVYRVHDGGIWSGLQTEQQYVFHIKIRLALCDIEQSEEAVEFLYNSVMDWKIGRKSLWHNNSLIAKTFSIIYKRKGFLAVFRLFRKLFLFI